MDTISRYLSTIPPSKIEKLRLYHSLISEWNVKINLISRKDMGNFFHRHIVPCLCINKIVKFAPGSSVIDVGTGGGLPGIPLAIVNGDTNFTLVDSIGKKIIAVDDMVKKLALDNVKTKNIRVEMLSDKFDCVVARAVSNLPKFLKDVRNICKKDTRIFYIKGGDFTGELQNVARYRVHAIGTLLGDGTFGDKSIIEIF
jgi:16S rRNA (guanine527-N7)-methyltransferase